MNHGPATWSAGVTVGMALAMDMVVGEPPQGIHPVCWMGKAISLTERVARQAAGVAGGGPGTLRLAGTVTALTLPAAVILASRKTLNLLPERWRGMAEAGLIYTALAAGSLGRSARDVDAGLAAGVEQGREAVSHLVGRDTACLSEDAVARAAVESVAENTNDGVVAPLFYAFIGGAPLALAYRMVNTLDSMVGYRNERYREFGWASARLDDLAGLIPARLTALAVAAASLIIGADARGAVDVWCGEAAGHPSPNAGVCEGAFAGALGLQLGGANAYDGAIRQNTVLGKGLRRPGRGDISRAVGLMYSAVAVVATAGTLASWVLKSFRAGRRQAGS